MGESRQWFTLTVMVAACLVLLGAGALLGSCGSSTAPTTTAPTTAPWRYSTFPPPPEPTTTTSAPLPSGYDRSSPKLPAGLSCGDFAVYLRFSEGLPDDEVRAYLLEADCI